MDDEWSVSEAGRGSSMSHVLVFDECVASDRADLVGEAVEFLTTLPGVTEVEHVEREVIEFIAPGVPTSRLSEALRGWWNAAMQERRPWMVATDRAAQTVYELVAAYGYQRHGLQLTRALGAELTHVITMDHHFGRSPHDHTITLTANVMLCLPDPQHFTVVFHTGGLDDEAALTSAVTDRVIPALDILPTVDAMLDRWQVKQSIEESGRQPYWITEGRLHARVLVSRGRLAEARQVYQEDFEGSQPMQRPHLLRLVERLGVPPLTTGSSPHLTVAEEATLAAWQAHTTAANSLLREVTGARLDGSRRSLDELWAWLRQPPDRLQATFADTTPALGPSFYGYRTCDDIRSGRVAFEPWRRATAELVTAYLGQVVIRRARGTVWGVAGDGELAMVRHGGTGVLSRVFTIADGAIGVPVDRFDPRRLRQLADDMVRWVNDGRYPPWVVRLGTPGP
ncbi:hypothetical protein [Catellatospora sichuanensis]|uniref:hypothetical protein n=1 Tax=Catellatospora sichuanensis TaxID=1969805 RepID=UPI0011823F9B|nr:hypothetical protein [Catellatospora sichuanensis]